MSIQRLEDILSKYKIYILPTLKTHEIYSLLLVLGLVDRIPHYDRPFGILGWDIDYEPAEWVSALVGKDWNPRLNPILLENQTWIHHTDMISGHVVRKAIMFIRSAKKEGKYRWKSILPDLIEVDVDNLTEPFNKLINSDKYNTAMVGVDWYKHMRFVYKDGKHLSFYDPWMQDLNNDKYFNKMTKDLKKEYGYSSAFVSRHEDQSDENSCVIDSLARCMLIAEYGPEAAFWPWNNKTFDYALLAARVIHLISIDHND